MKNQEGYENSSDFLEITENGNSKKTQTNWVFFKQLTLYPNKQYC